MLGEMVAGRLDQSRLHLPTFSNVSYYSFVIEAFNNQNVNQFCLFLV